MAKDKKQPVIVIAELEVTWPDGQETIKTFDRAWHRLMELPVPAHMYFVRFGRID